VASLDGASVRQNTRRVERVPQVVNVVPPLDRQVPGMGVCERFGRHPLHAGVDVEVPRHILEAILLPLAVQKRVCASPHTLLGAGP
jgi:hypothetical protein